MVASPAVWMTVAGELGVDVHTLQNLSGPHGEVPLKELRFGSPSLQNDKAKAKLLRVMAERRLAGCIINYNLITNRRLGFPYPCACTCRLCQAEACTEIQG